MVSDGDDGGGGSPMQEGSVDLHYKMVVVVPHRWTDMVPDLHCKTVVVLAPCRRDLVADLIFKMVMVLADINRKMKVVCVPFRRDMVADLSHKMVVASCKREMVSDLNYKMQAQPSRTTRCRAGEQRRAGERQLAGEQWRAGERQLAEERQQAREWQPAWDVLYCTHFCHLLKCLLRMNYSFQIYSTINTLLLKLPVFPQETVALSTVIIQ